MIKEIRIHNLENFLSSLKTEMNAWQSAQLGLEVWFRGVTNADWPLLPSAHRHTTYDEQSAFQRFCHQAPFYTQKKTADKWEMYYDMQHYGLPTRLLDWSLSPLASLYFAFEREWRQDNKSPAIWMIDPAGLNDFFYGERLIHIMDAADFSSSFLPDFKQDARTPKTKPIFILPIVNNPRIFAQQGMFSVHGTDSTSIDTLMEVCPDKDKLICKFVFEPAPGKTMDDLYDEMNAWVNLLGFSKDRIYPELSNIAATIKQNSIR
jgi:hypothetical protein